MAAGAEQVAQPLIEASSVDVGRLAHPLGDPEDLIELGGHGWKRTASATDHFIDENSPERA